jgi:hypothetical protein
LNKVPIVDLGELSKGCPALTTAKGNAFAEAAAVCLEHNDHGIEVQAAVAGTYEETIRLIRVVVTEQMRRGNADLQDATEDRATGIAILAAKRYTGYTIVERKAKVGGFDWYLGNEPEDEFSLIENIARLEVSGILKGDDRDIAKRVRQSKGR